MCLVVSNWPTRFVSILDCFAGAILEATFIHFYHVEGTLSYCL